MRQPPGYGNPDFPTHICKLKRPIHGLKQASRAWYIKLKNYLLSLDFYNSYFDAYIFFTILSLHYMSLFM